MRNCVPSVRWQSHRSGAVQAAILTDVLAIMMEADLLSILCCPLTHQPLREASSDELQAFGSDLAAGLIREDGQVLYPVRNGIPLLVSGEAIPLTREPSPQ